MTGAIYAQNHPWIFSSLSTPILIIYFNSILKTLLNYVKLQGFTGFYPFVHQLLKIL